MKNLLSTMVLAVSMFSCLSEKETDLQTLNFKEFSLQYPQKWQLVEMYGSIANIPPSTGTDMEWKEYYLLYSDSTFIKSRKKDEVTVEESGIFVWESSSDGHFLTLIYQSDNELIGNCSPEPQEVLFLNTNNMLVGTWQNCDGPGLLYKKD